MVEWAVPTMRSAPPLQDTTIMASHPCGILPRVLKRCTVSPSGCWLWQGRLARGGYPQSWADGRTRMAHRIVYELIVALIPPGMQMDHLCRVRHCCNPNHLDVVTPKENSNRGLCGANHGWKTHCARGHPYDDANTRYYRNSRGVVERKCHACNIERTRERAARKRETGCANVSR